jgi:hypothetical protein
MASASSRTRSAPASAVTVGGTEWEVAATPTGYLKSTWSAGGGPTRQAAKPARLTGESAQLAGCFAMKSTRCSRKSDRSRATARGGSEDADRADSRGDGGT